MINQLIIYLYSIFGTYSVQYTEGGATHKSVGPISLSTLFGTVRNFLKQKITTERQIISREHIIVC